jgi:hypothetical protein
VTILRNIRLVILAGLSLAGIIALFSFPPIAQDPAYHNLSDQRTLLGIPNFWNVASNACFIFVGALGLIFLRRIPEQVTVKDLYAGYTMFFMGTLLVGFGSFYYHMIPSNGTLLWDRLPMAISFTAFMSIIIGEYIDRSLGRFLLWPLVLCGIASVIYWILTENMGQGDLRPYIVAQFMPAALTPIIVLLFGRGKTGNIYIWMALAAYAIAKTVEMLDASIWSYSGMFMSGHSLKHLFAALGAFLLLVYARNLYTQKSSHPPLNPLLYEPWPSREGKV